jgi:cystathionine beta-lyase/cystathionine gamma-synthase
VKTLPLRLRAQSAAALTVARYLKGHPLVERVHYPGLASFPQAGLAARQHLGAHGGVVTFEPVGGAAGGRAVLNAVRLCRLVEHVGSVETLITHPATMTHGDVPPEQRRRVGITDGLVRLSVGLERVDDIVEDLDRALAAAGEVARGDRGVEGAGELAAAGAKGGAL